MPSPISRRSFCAALGAAALAGCNRATSPRPDHASARLSARPGTPPTGAVEPGIHPLGLATARDGWLVVPEGYDGARAWPLALFFHGAITPALTWMELMRPLADEAGLVLLAPDARQRTWDLVLGGFGADVEFVDEALAAAFSRVRVDPARVSACGFSDGGSYALSLGASNGDFLPKLAAYSPGFYAPLQPQGRPSFFITHGTQDTVLPIEQTSRPMVAQLRAAGYTVRYEEFEGGHAVSQARAKESFAWMAGTG